MSRKRSISSDISTDKQLNKMGMKYGDGAQLFYLMLITHADDEGIVTGDTWELLGLVWGGRRDKTEDDVIQAMEACVEFGLLLWDRDASRIYFPVSSWYKYQSYIKKENRRTEDPMLEIPEQRKTAENSGNNNFPSEVPENSGEQRRTAENTVSLSFSFPGPGSFPGPELRNPEDDQVVHSPAHAQEPDSNNQVLPDLTATQDLSSSNGTKSQNREPTPNNEPDAPAHWPEIWPVLSQAWFQHMGGLPPSATAEALKDYVAQGLTVPVIVDAMAQCDRDHRIRDWGYLRGILENRRIRGHTTLRDVEAYERQRTGIRARDAPKGSAMPDDTITWED